LKSLEPDNNPICVC